MTTVCTTLPAPVASFAVGAQPVLEALVTDPETEAPVNPSVVAVKVRPPDGVVATYTALSSPAVTNVGVGLYRLVLPAVTQAGDWFYRFEASGSVVDAQESRFHVDGSAFGAPSAPAAGRWISATELLADVRLADIQLPSGVTLDDCVEASTDMLHRWSGGRYKIRTATIRPLLACGVTEVLLPPGSVVNEVKVDGVVLATTAYAVYNGRLVRQDGLSWVSQSLSVPNGQPGSWSVTYTLGPLPPRIGLLACRELSIWTAQSFSNKPGRAPNRATEVRRGGVMVPIARRKMADGTYTTGIPIVDDFLNAVNPNGLRRRSRITSPDVAHARVGGGAGVLGDGDIIDEGEV